MLSAVVGRNGRVCKITPSIQVYWVPRKKVLTGVSERRNEIKTFLHEADNINSHSGFKEARVSADLKYIQNLK